MTQLKHFLLPHYNALQNVQFHSTSFQTLLLYLHLPSTVYAYTHRKTQSSTAPLHFRQTTQYHPETNLSVATPYSICTPFFPCCAFMFYCDKSTH